MSTQSATDFFNKVYADPKLRGELQKVGDINHGDLAKSRSNGDEIAAIGKKNGFNFNPDEAKDAYKVFVAQFAGNNNPQEQELSEAELETVAGGLAKQTTATNSSICCKTC
jgi:predicted ribosomally synthesized peptide with nif11-like leader